MKCCLKGEKEQFDDLTFQPAFIYVQVSLPENNHYVPAAGLQVTGANSESGQCQGEVVTYNILFL